MPQTDLLRKAFRDIVAGCSAGTVLSRPCFVKHLRYDDHIAFDTKREEYYNEAKTAGLPTEEDKVAILKRQHLWSDQKDEELARAKQYIIDLHEGKRKNLKMPSLVKQYARQIEEAEKQYYTKLNEKRRLLELTCEVFADKCINDYYVVSNLYADKGLTEPLFSDAEFDTFRDEMVVKVIDDYNGIMEGCSERNVRKLAMQDFFQRRFQLVGDDLMAFFGRPICDLTEYQVDLLRAGAHFRNIYQNHDTRNWSKEVQEDPDLLTDYARSVEEGKKQLEQQGANDANAIVLGARKEDAAALGIKNQGPVKPQDMKAMLLGQR